MRSMTCKKFKKIIYGEYPLEVCSFEFPDGTYFYVEVHLLGCDGTIGCTCRSTYFDNFNDAIKEYLFCLENYKKDSIDIYINLKSYGPELPLNNYYVATLLFDYIY